MIHVPAPFLYKGKFIPQGEYKPSSEEEAKDLLAAISRLSERLKSSSSEEETPEENFDKKYSEEELKDLVDEAVSIAKGEQNNLIAELQAEIEKLKAKLQK